MTALHRLLYDFSTDDPDSRDPTALIVIVTTIPIVVGIAILVIICCCPNVTRRIENYINSNHQAESDRVYGNTVLRRQMEEEEKKKEDPAKRRERLREYFEKNAVQMVVSKDLFVQNKKRSDSAITLSTSKSSSDKDTESISVPAITNASSSSDLHPDQDQNDEELQMPNTSMTLSIEEEEKEICIPVTILAEDGTERQVVNGGRKINNCCAICLCGYDEGDTITWSIHESCRHAFHNECILDYLQGQISTPCPCCRRDFTDMLPKDEAEVERGERLPMVTRLRRNTRALARRATGGRRYSTVQEVEA